MNTLYTDVYDEMPWMIAEQQEQVRILLLSILPLSIPPLSILL